MKVKVSTFIAQINYLTFMKKVYNCVAIPSRKEFLIYEIKKNCYFRFTLHLRFSCL